MMERVSYRYATHLKRKLKEEFHGLIGLCQHMYKKCAIKIACGCTELKHAYLVSNPNHGQGKVQIPSAPTKNHQRKKIQADREGLIKFAF